MGKFKEKWKAFDNKVGRYGETVKCGIYAVMGFGMFLIGDVIVRSITPFVGFPPVVLIGFISSAMVLIGFFASIINGFLFLWNGIKDLFSLPGKAIQKAKEEKVRKECEQAEAELQAKIDAEAASYKAMADNGDAEAIKEIAKVYYKNGKKEEAQKLYEEAAQLGDIDAQLKLADNYRQVLSAEEWASKAEKNPNASDGQKEYAQKLKNEIKEYRIEAYQRFRDAEAAKWRRIEEAQRRREAEMNLPVQGDFFAVRPGESCCMNDGNACRFCARRVWAAGEGWCRSSRCYL